MIVLSVLMSCRCVAEFPTGNFPGQFTLWPFFSSGSSYTCSTCNRITVKATYSWNSAVGGEEEKK